MIQLQTNQGRTFQQLKANKPTSTHYLYYTLQGEPRASIVLKDTAKTYYENPSSNDVAENVGVWFTAVRSLNGFHFNAAGPIFLAKEKLNL